MQYLQTYNLRNMYCVYCLILLCRLGYMIWSDVAHKVIVAAPLNGSGLVVRVNLKMNVTGEVCLCVYFVQWVNSSIINIVIDRFIMYCS